MSPEEFYSACNLKGNPFRTNPVVDDDPRVKIWVGYDRQRVQLEKIIERVRADQVGLTNFILLYGHYGTGKSHALLWARNRVKETGAGIAYLIPTLKKDKGKLSFAAALYEDLVERGSLLNDLLSFRTFCEGRALEVKNGQEMPTKQAIDLLIKSRELAEFVKELLDRENAQEVKALLNPGKLSDYQAVMLFSKIVNLFVQEFETPAGKKRFKPAVFLLVDELDDLQRQPPKEVLETNDILRHLYDACPNAFGLVCALAAEVTTLTNSFTDYILSRVTRQVHFDLLDRETAIAFVGAILEKSRAEEDSERSGFFPFTDEAVHAVVSQLREITPRKIVNTMQQVVEECRLVGINPKEGPITADRFDQLEILDAVFGEGAAT